MKIYCTRPGCSRPDNSYADLDDRRTLKTVQQKYCSACGMPLILDGRYLCDRLLGRGGFGAAFLAYDRRSPTMRACVVKQFLPAGDLDPQQLATAQGLFEREALVLDRLGHQHPLLPDLLAYFPLEAPGWQSSIPQQFFYIVQEYIDGRDLEAELATRGPFSEAEVVEVLEEILKILEFVHSQDVIHRDIKPSNIMRDRSGRLHLLDFGAVKEVTQNPGGRSTGIYSAGFAPPEQMRGRSVYPSTDLYALAVTAVMLLTAKNPEDLFDSYSDTWIWKDQVSISDPLAQILERMLQPTPSDRFGSAAEVLRILSPTTPLPPPPPSPAQPVAPPQGGTQIQRTTLRRPFSTVEILTGAAFTGLEGGLLAIVLRPLFFQNPALSLLLGAIALGGLIFAQRRRWLERFDLLILAAVSFPILAGIAVKTGTPPPIAIAVPLFAGLVGVAVTALFRLIYATLRRLL